MMIAWRAGSGSIGSRSVWEGVHRRQSFKVASAALSKDFDV
jgi:hypothetical protein